MIVGGYLIPDRCIYILLDAGTISIIVINSLMIYARSRRKAKWTDIHPSITNDSIVTRLVNDEMIFAWFSVGTQLRPFVTFSWL